MLEQRDLVEDLEAKPFELKSAPARPPSIETAARAPNTTTTSMFDR
jgi:hypothetical protein